MKNLSFVRIKNLFIHYLVENWKRDALCFAILLLTPSIFKSFFKAYSPYITMSIMVFFVLSLYLCSIIFAPLSKKHRQLQYLMIPANTTEKVITNWLIVYLFQTLIAFLCLVAGLYLSNLVYPLSSVNFQTNIADIEYWHIISVLLVILPIVGFGSVYFKKKALIKTMFAGGIIFIVFTIVYAVLYKYLYKDYFSHLHIPEGMTFYNLRDFPYISYQTAKTISVCVTILWSVFFWVLSYFRLKETEA